MRLFAEERKLGTLELLWTYPVRDVEIIAGKFLACLAVVTRAARGDGRRIRSLLARFYPSTPGRSSPATSGSGCSRRPSSRAASSSRRSPTASWSPARRPTASSSSSGSLTWNEAAVNEVTLRLLVPFSLFDRFYAFARRRDRHAERRLPRALHDRLPRASPSSRSTRAAGGGSADAVSRAARSWAQLALQVAPPAGRRSASSRWWPSARTGAST